MFLSAQCKVHLTLGCIRCCNFNCLSPPLVRTLIADQMPGDIVVSDAAEPVSWLTSVIQMTKLLFLLLILLPPHNKNLIDLQLTPVANFTHCPSVWLFHPRPHTSRGINADPILQRIKSQIPCSPPSVARGPRKLNHREWMNDNEEALNSLVILLQQPQRPRNRTIRTTDQPISHVTDRPTPSSVNAADFAFPVTPRFQFPVPG